MKNTAAIYCCIFTSWTRSRNILHGRYATSTRYI